MAKKVKPRYEQIGIHPGLRRMSDRALEDCGRRYTSARTTEEKDGIVRRILDHHDGLVAFTSAQRQTLFACLVKDVEPPELVEEVIDDLREVCQWGADNTAHMQNYPTKREVEAALEKIGNLAFNLSHALTYPDRAISGRLGIGLHSIFGDSALQVVSKLSDLGAFAASWLAEGVEIPRHNHVLDIESIHNVLQRWGIQCKPSRNKELRFYKIAVACFEAMGLSVGPEDAIRQYQKSNRQKCGATHPQKGNIASD